MKAATRSAGDGASPVSAMSHGWERWNRSRSAAIEPRRWLSGSWRSCSISRRGEPDRIRVPPPPGATRPMKLTTNRPRGRSRCGSVGLSQCHSRAGTSQAPGSGKVTSGRPQSRGGEPGGRAEQVTEDAADPLGEDPRLAGIALGRFQVARDRAPGRAVVAADAAGVRQLPPPPLFHGEGVGGRERLPDDHVAVALEAPDVRRGEGGEHEVRLPGDGAPRQIIRPGLSRRVRSTAGCYPTAHREAR